MKKAVVIIMSLCFFLLAAPCAMAQGEFYDDLPRVKIADGVQKDYYKSGKLKMVSEIVGRKRHGITKFYDEKGQIKIKYLFRQGKFVKAFVEETKNDLGFLAIFLTFKFWAAVLVIGAGLWFVGIKALFKNRPI